MHNVRAALDGVTMEDALVRASEGVLCSTVVLVPLDLRSEAGRSVEIGARLAERWIKEVYRRECKL